MSKKSKTKRHYDEGEMEEPIRCLREESKLDCPNKCNIDRCLVDNRFTHTVGLIIPSAKTTLNVV